MKLYKFCAPFLIAAACSVVSAQTPASDAPTRDDVLKMFDVMHLRSQMQRMIDIMGAQVKRQVQDSLQKNPDGTSADEQAKIEASSADAMNIYPIGEMLDDVVPIYQRHMTKSDVDAIVAFYSSPAGQHLLEQSPAMMQETMTTVMPKINARTKAYLEKMTKQMGGSAPVAAPAPAPAPPAAAPPQK